jgi:hypothetical protein
MTAVRQGPYGRADLLAGALLGFESLPPLPAPVPGRSPRDVAEGLILEALRRGRVGVALLGGSGSAAMLAGATAQARLHGLEEPVALSLDFARPEMAEDERYRERVVDHLQLRHRWERVPVADGELELLGPHARATLTEHGLLYPANVYWVRPLLERLGGGTLVVAHAQEESFDYWPFGPLVDALRGRRPHDRATIQLAALAALPPPVRARVLRARFPPPELPWLRPAGRAALAEAWEVPAVPLRYGRAVDQGRGQRCFRAIPNAYTTVAAAYGVTPLFPYQAPAFTSAVIAHFEGRGLGEQEQTLERIVGDLLPGELAGGRDRTAYGGVFFGPSTREFAARWSGGGLDEELVDPEALRALWTSERYDWRTSALLHLAWLHDRAAGLE